MTPTLIGATSYAPYVVRGVTFATTESFLAAGTYWLRLHGASNGRGALYWDVNGDQPGAGEISYGGQGFPTSYRAAFTLYGDAVVAAGVPEPAAWALMLGGFALTGGLLRRRRVCLTALG